MVECRPVAALDGIDVHAHFFPERFLRAIEEAGPEAGARVDRSDHRGPAIVAGASRTAPLEARFYDIGKRLRSMNQQGVRVQALSLTVPMIYWAPGAVGAALARAWND